MLCYSLAELLLNPYYPQETCGGRLDDCLLDNPGLECAVRYFPLLQNGQNIITKSPTHAKSSGLMNLNSRTQGNILILAPQGRIDHASSNDFSVALEPYLEECKLGGTPLVLDFSGIEYISSVGLRALMLASRQIKAQNGRIAIAALTPGVKEVFEISRFNLVYKVFDSVDEAVTGVL